MIPTRQNYDSKRGNQQENKYGISYVPFIHFTQVYDTIQARYYHAFQPGKRMKTAWNFICAIQCYSAGAAYDDNTTQLRIHAGNRKENRYGILYVPFA